MVRRRVIGLSLLPLLALPRAGTEAAAVAGPEPRRSCGDPGGRFIACEALQDSLPVAAGGPCPLCGGRHRVPVTP
ncbi:hypothetical protein [Roseomonas rosulenta]|uniref:hypothetical protein n=1 Tax=Roseomonas rosulenta TaxID=2748667 RepID=UPI0018DFE5D8|nr:hypothetical protein [Roseomonas rosulenta]